MTIPLYGLAMIVKDEEAVLRRCLESAKPYIGYWTISDTGSTDNTRAIIHEILGDIPGRLFDLPFLSFGHNRSEVFAAAQGMSQWILCLDADMSLEIDDGFVPDSDWDAGMIEMGGADFSYRLPLLLNGRRSWKSVGAVHEYTLLTDGTLGRREPTDKVRVTHHGEGRSSPAKTAWHAKLLEADLELDPDNPRTVFYLAQTYRELEDLRARKIYLRRSGMGGFAEEAWYAAYRAALLADRPDRIDELMVAWEMRPHRLEPLHALVQELNQRDLHHAAYQLSLIPAHPTIDVLFVHRDVWAWGLMFERSIAAWWCGYRDESRLLGEELLTRDLPDHIRGAVLRNLAFTEPVAA